MGTTLKAVKKQTNFTYFKRVRLTFAMKPANFYHIFQKLSNVLL